MSERPICRVLGKNVRPRGNGIGTKILGTHEDSGGIFGCKFARFLDLVFERPQFAFDKPADCQNQQLLLMGNLKPY